MRWLLLMVALIATSAVAESNYIRTTGEGFTFEQAKQNAFTEAVQIKVGTIVLSEREHLNNKTIINEVIVHSAGFVDDFKVIGTTNYNGRYRVTVDVLVSESKLTNQILSVGKSSGYVDGNRIGAQYQTYLEQKRTGDQVLNNLLKNYPSKAYSIKQEPYSLTIDRNRNALLTVPFQLSWNYEFVKSFNETMSVLQDGSNGFLKPSLGTVTVMVKRPEDFVVGTKNEYLFNDLKRINQIHDAFLGGRTVRILMTIRDSGGQAISKTCWQPEFLTGRKSAFYGVGTTNNIFIYGNQKEVNSIMLIIEPNRSSILQYMNSVELSIIPEMDC
jgi:hypothetical protein